MKPHWRGAGQARGGRSILIVWWPPPGEALSRHESLYADVVWLRRRNGDAAAVLLGLTLSLHVAGLGAALEISARTTPPINDISTDTENPPVFWFTATPSDFPASNAEPQRAAYPDVRPLEIPASADAAFVTALALVEERGWEVLSADPAESQIETIATSRKRVLDLHGKLPNGVSLSGMVRAFRHDAGERLNSNSCGADSGNGVFDVVGHGESPSARC